MTTKIEGRAQPARKARPLSEQTPRIVPRFLRIGLTLVCPLALGITFVYLMGAFYTPSVVAL